MDIFIYTLYSTDSQIVRMVQSWTASNFQLDNFKENFTCLAVSSLFIIFASSCHVVAFNIYSLPCFACSLVYMLFYVLVRVPFADTGVFGTSQHPNIVNS